MLVHDSMLALAKPVFVDNTTLIAVGPVPNTQGNGFIVIQNGQETDHVAAPLPGP